MKNVKRMPKLIGRCKRAVYAIAAAVLAGSMFLGTGVTVEAVKLADVFDTQAYANKYPDLFAAFGNNATALLKHYKEHGIVERREVEGILDVVRYREAYPDLDAAFGDNWDAYVNHYLVFGAKEGRENFTDFDGLAYAERYPDLKEAYGDDLLALYKHYQAFGKSEGRNAETYDEPEDVDEEDEDEDENDETYIIEKWYYEDGSVRTIDVKRKDGTPVRNTAYNKDGTLAGETVYNDEGKPSELKAYNKGVLMFRSVFEYKNGKQVKNTMYYYDKTGSKVTSWTVTINNDDGTRTATSYDADGKVTSRTEYDADGKVTNTEAF